MNNWIKSYLGIGGQVWVIDAGFSYVKLVELLRGNTSSTAQTLNASVLIRSANLCIGE